MRREELRWVEGWFVREFVASAGLAPGGGSLVYSPLPVLPSPSRLGAPLLLGLPARRVIPPPYALRWTGGLGDVGPGAYSRGRPMVISWRAGCVVAALVLAVVAPIRSKGQSLEAWGVGILAIVFLV